MFDKVWSLILSTQRSSLAPLKKGEIGLKSPFLSVPMVDSVVFSETHSSSYSKVTKLK
jgi:hypothetical protein